MKKMIRFGFVFAFLFSLNSLSVFAAQLAQVIVPEANVYLYPQSASKVLSKLKKNTSVSVSNLPTEGFFKVRLANGDLGWLSGNDILTTAAGQGSSPSPDITPSNRTRAMRRPPMRRNDPEESESSGGTSANEDSFRASISYGIQSLSYSGLKDNYDSVTGLNLGKNFGIELQFKMNPKLYWAIRLESFSADSGRRQLNSVTSQQVTIKELPVSIGLMWSPVNSHRFRLGFGAYLGVAFAAKSTIEQQSSATGQDTAVEYDTVELCGTLASQITVGVGDAFGVLFEMDYRYDQTGPTPRTTKIKDVSGFKIDYSGVVARVGLELRF